MNEEKLIEQKEKIALPAPKWWERVLEIFRRHKKYIIAGLAVSVILVAGILLVKIIVKPAPKFMYQTAVFPYSQGNDSPESIKGDMKAGDVLVIKKEEEGKTIAWSNTERISYLILKMELTEEQAQKLTMQDEKEIPFKDWSDEEKQMAEEEEKRAKEEDREYMREPKRETLRPRLYYIDLIKKPFNDLDRNVLLSGQPFADEVFDWGIVEKKDKIK